MPKALKIPAYILLFIFSFLFFLYHTFPYDILKDRLVNTIEQKLGEEYDVKVGELSPSFFTGAVLKQVKIQRHGAESDMTVWEASKVRLRTSLGSMLFGKMNVKFAVKNQKSEISGAFKSTDEGFNFSGSMDDFNIGDLKMLGASEGSVKLTSAINGAIKLVINKKQAIQSSGSADLELSDIVLKAGTLKLGEGVDFALPEIVFSKDSGSTLKFELARGGIHISELRLQDGDIKLDLSGDIFMSSVFKNYRMNLKGNFSVTPKVEQAVPLLFMVEKQRAPDGSYPVTITGRVGQPTIKIGDFTLPI